MGRMILCRGVEAAKPYTFRLSNVRVRSIEELCHYLYHNIYEVTEDLFDETLIEWLEKEAELPQLAERLRNLTGAGSGLVEIVAGVFRSCDYYSEAEIVYIMGVVEELSHKPYYGRQKIKADNYMKYKKYADAIRGYEKLLNGGMVGNLSPEEYGDALHNLSVAYMHADRLEEASDGFKKAYASNQRPRTLESYLYSLLLSGRGEDMEKEAAALGWGREKADEYKKKMEDYLVEAEGMEELKRLRREWKRTDGMKAGAVPENINRFILEWKAKYREGFRIDQ